MERGTGEKRMERTDTQILKDVTEHLRWDVRVDSSLMEVAVENGAVTLRGEVEAYVERTAAVDVAWSVAGVREVNNHLTVRRPPSESAASDEELQDRVSSVIAWNANMNQETVHATVSDGAVTLEGTVNAHWKRFYAEELVGSIVGVTHIHNQLAVAPSQTFLGQVVAEQVVAALVRNPQVDADQVEVAVKLGVVTLAGYVSSGSARRAAERDASVTPGVSAVKNRLGIRAAA